MVCAIGSSFSFSYPRWNYFLNPKVRKGVWTDDEDRTILYFQNLLGNKWAKIANSLPGR